MSESINAPRFIAAQSADPRQAPWGILSYDPWSGGVGMFTWYVSPGDLLEVLLEEELPLIRAEGYHEESDLDAYVTKLKEAIVRIRSGEPAADVFDGLFDASPNDIAWIGAFDELCGGDGTWVRSFRRDFRDADARGDSEITQQEIERFIGYAREYGY